MTPEQAKDRRLQREFGITLATYKAVLEYQGGVCAICKMATTAKGKAFKNAFAVDHDHKTGLVRGLLCWGCNKALGVFRDDLFRMKNAVTYLENPPVTTVVGKPVYTAPGKVGTKKRAKLLRGPNDTKPTARRRTRKRASAASAPPHRKAVQRKRNPGRRRRLRSS